MARLTPKLLGSYPYSRYADLKTIQRGHAYHQQGRVWDITLSRNDSRALCMVDGNSGEYTVEIEVDQGSGQLYFECDCPYAENNFCKHMVAAALELSEYLKDEADDFDEDIEAEIIPSSRPQTSKNWQNKLNEKLALVPRQLHQPGSVCCSRNLGTRETVEEKILQLQEKKRTLVKNIIATESGFFKSLTKDDVKALFS